MLCIVPPYGRAEYCPILPDPEEEGDTALTLLPVKENVCGRGKTNKKKKNKSINKMEVYSDTLTIKHVLT